MCREHTPYYRHTYTTQAHAASPAPSCEPDDPNANMHPTNALHEHTYTYTSYTSHARHR